MTVTHTYCGVIWHHYINVNEQKRQHTDLRFTMWSIINNKLKLI